MLSFVTSFINYLLPWSQLAIEIFGGTLFLWEGMISLVQAICQPSQDALPRRERRRLEKLAWLQQYTRFGCRLPLLVMLPAACMVLTYVIIILLGTKTSPFPRVTPYFIRGCYDVRHQVANMDRILMLDSSVWVQVSNAKATYLFQTLVPPSSDSDVWMGRPVGLLVAFRKPIILPLLSTTPLDDCCWMAGEFIPCAFGASSVTLSIDAVMTQFASASSTDDPSAFIFFDNRPTTHQQELRWRLLRTKRISTAH